VQLSNEAFHGWMQWATDNGASLTAWLEVWGLRLASPNLPKGFEQYSRTKEYAEIVSEARRITAEHRRRRR